MPEPLLTPRCTKHEPVPQFDRPTEANSCDLRLSYTLNQFGCWVRCTKCGLTGVITEANNTRWFVPGTVGFLTRDRKAEKARAWNEKVAADALSAKVEG